MDADTSSAAVPRHIAIIMDGNGRWAKSRHLPRAAGHTRGVESVRRVIEACMAKGIAHLTLFAFSSENWQRPAEEVSLLMRLFVSSLQREIDSLARNGVRLRVVGDIDAFDKGLRKLIHAAEQRSATADRLHLTICASYGGRWDIAQAAVRLAREVAAGTAQPSFEAFEKRLAMSFAPDPDLLIRTGGESRISNFLLWQLAYAELYFTDTLWPDFDAAALETALAWFAARERRFGRISEQVAAAPVDAR